MNWPAVLLRAVAGPLSRSGGRARLIVLTYHRLLAEADPLLPGETDAAQLRMQLQVLRDSFNVLRLDAACEQLRRGVLPSRAVCLTFDDGYASNARVAVPILQELGLTATFFIATGFINGGRMFNDTVIETVRRLPQRADLQSVGLGDCPLPDDQARRDLIDTILSRVKYLPLQEREQWVDRLARLAQGNLPDDLMMTDQDVVRMHRAGMEIGGHTHLHPILTQVDPQQARDDINQGKQVLESLTGAPVVSFAYPNGQPGRDYAVEHTRMVRECGFAQAVTTARGIIRPQPDWWQLPRIGSWDRTPQRFAARLLQSYLLNPAATAGSED